MDTIQLAPLLRMVERSLIVLGGILSIYLGYKLFVLGIDKTQGSASAFKLIELKNFGPGLFFAALGAVVLVTTMKAAIRVNPETTIQQSTSVKENDGASSNPNSKETTALFFGMEDTKRVSNQWSATSFFLETRELIDHLEKGEPIKDKKALIDGISTKLNSITMDQSEYKRYQELIDKIPLKDSEQKELERLELKLFPRKIK